MHGFLEAEVVGNLQTEAIKHFEMPAITPLQIACFKLLNAL